MDSQKEAVKKKLENLYGEDLEIFSVARLSQSSPGVVLNESELWGLLLIQGGEFLIFHHFYNPGWADFVYRQNRAPQDKAVRIPLRSSEIQDKLAGKRLSWLSRLFSSPLGDVLVGTEIYWELEIDSARIVREEEHAGPKKFVLSIDSVKPFLERIKHISQD